MSEPSPLPATGQAPAAVAQQPSELKAYLAFRIDRDEYAIDILRVLEIVGELPVTRLPGSPPIVSGVVNLRGTVIPVLSLRLLVASPSPGAAGLGALIIVEQDQEQIGLAVDQMLGILRIGPGQIGPDSGPVAAIGPAFVTGVIHAQGAPKRLLDLDRILGMPATLA